MKKCYPAKLESIDSMSLDVENFCAENNLDSSIHFAFTLSLDELITNTVNYGCANKKDVQINLEMKIIDNAICAILEDNAALFDPTKEVRNPDISSDVESREIGGLGIFFCKKNMDEFEYSSKNGMNTITMKKYLSK